MTTTIKEPVKKAWTTGQLARATGFSPSTIIAHIRDGHLKAFRLPGKKTHQRIPAEEAERFIASLGA